MNHVYYLLNGTKQITNNYRNEITRQQQNGNKV